MAKRAERPIAVDGENRLFLGNGWTSAVFGQKPHINLSVLSSEGAKPETGLTIKLAPSDARRLAQALLSFVADVGRASKKGTS